MAGTRLCDLSEGRAEGSTGCQETKKDRRRRRPNVARQKAKRKTLFFGRAVEGEKKIGQPSQWTDAGRSGLGYFSRRGRGWKGDKETQTQTTKRSDSWKGGRGGRLSSEVRKWARAVFPGSARALGLLCCPGDSAVLCWCWCWCWFWVRSACHRPGSVLL